ncbi:MAG TPA: SCO family protein [Steroidobacteraceae bacterium]
MNLFVKLLLCSAVACFAEPASQAAPSDPPESIYHLQARLTNQAGQVHGLDVYRGQPVLITMFYGRCPMTCPLLIDTLKTIERHTSAEQRARLRVLMISVDPENDTPAALHRLAKQRRIDLTRWTLARADEKTVRKIAAVLGIRYRKLPNGAYNHSSVITLLDQNGVVVARSSEIGKADQAILMQLK